MKIELSLLAAAVIATAPAFAQESAPAVCRPDSRGEVDFRACAAVAAPGSGARALALINLGTEAFLDGNYAEAVRLYDDAVPPGKEIKSDVRFHAYRGSAYQHVGRTAEAYKDAQFALSILNGTANAPPEFTVPKERQPTIYELILPILKANRDPGLSSALSAYSVLPAQTWIDWANRAAVLEQTDALPAAVKANLEALKLAPTHPAVLNNHCYILTRSGDAKSALPYCQKALEAAPDQAAVHHSYASALAGAGQCAQANTELDAARRLDPSSATYKKPLTCKPS